MDGPLPIFFFSLYQTKTEKMSKLMKEVKMTTVLPVLNVISGSKVNGITPNMFKLVRSQNLWRMENLKTKIMFVISKTKVSFFLQKLIKFIYSEKGHKNMRKSPS